MSFSLIFASALTQALLHSLWQGALLALLAAALLSTFARSSAALKHALGMVFLLAMAVLPVVTLVSLLNAGSAIASTGLAAQGPHDGSTLALMSPGVHLISAPAWLPWLWCGGVVVMLLRLIGGGWMVRRLDRKAFTALPPAWQARVEALRHAMGIRRAVAVRLLQGVGLPCSARAWRPVIWLPISMLTEALLFYHPGVWWLSRRIRQERENACDDLAVAACGDAIVLAEALANLEKLRRSAHIFTLSAAGGSLMQRVTRLIFPHTPSRLGWSVPTGLLAVLCSGVLLAAQVTPTTGHALAGTTLTDASSENTGNGSFEINGLFLGGWRVYRESVTPQGRITETYTVNGHPSRIDASARKWVANKRAAVGHALELPPIPALPPIASRADQTGGHWWQFAGNSFELDAPFAGGRRVYKSSVSLRGKIRESYTVNGKPAPIDVSVRQWIQDEQRKTAKLAQLPTLPRLPPIVGTNS